MTLAFRLTHSLHSAAAACVALALGACASNSSTTDDSALLSLRFENTSASAVRVSAQIAARSGSGALVAAEPIAGPTLTLKPSQTASYKVIAPEDYVPTDRQDRLVRLRLEELKPSWQQRDITWFEIVGPAVHTITIRPGDLGGVTLRSPEGRLAVLSADLVQKFGLD